ncbi:trypsin, alkaline C-like [Helicoverpa zea]|uniref:trypsin, alkaline C-like n=1 Tax=Helicoverpa zea TaxID=7113 RepID=UPI001F58D5DD|nr:trypsin, alkaline C-like [Helicoverpa zea]
MRVIAVLALCVAAVAASPSGTQRIVGGSLAPFGQYPGIVALLTTFNQVTYFQSCGGNILNNRSILTAAHCVGNRSPAMFRFRAGSIFANSGGVVYSVQQIINHPNYNQAAFLDYDFAIMRSASTIVFNNHVNPVRLAGANYNLADNQVVWAAGWGLTEQGGFSSEQLRHVQVYTINQEICRNRYAGRYVITENMLCSGVLDVGGRDQCQQDSGGPLYHNGVLVGVCSFGTGCAQAQFPGVNARVSRASAWIVSNA